MRFEPLALEEWFRHWRGVGTNLDISGAPSPYGEFSPDVEEGQDPIELEERLVEELSSLYGVEGERIALTFGAQNANALALLTQLSSTDTIAMENPIYEPMRAVAERICRVAVLPRIRENDFVPDLEVLDRLLVSGSRLVMITNLHNPTAAMLGDEDLLAIADIVEDRGALLLCDEIYREMSYSSPPESVHRFQDVGISTNGVTKLYGLGDLRVGWLIGPPDVARSVELARLATASHLPSHSLAVTIAALEQRNWFRERMLALAEENLNVLKEWSEREERVDFAWPEGTLMFLLSLPGEIDDMEFSELLLERFDTAVCPGRYFGIHGQVRVTLSCPPSEFRRGLENISSALDHLS